MIQGYYDWMDDNLALKKSVNVAGSQLVAVYMTELKRKNAVLLRK